MTAVIFLNGASSAGKTSLGKALQDILNEPYLLLGLDTYFHAVPARWASQGSYRHLGFQYVDLPPEEGHPVLGIGYGSVGWRILTGFHQATAELVRSGNPVIIDEMLLDEKVRDHWFDVLKPLGAFFVGVHCDLNELERREYERGNRPGLARWSAQRVHAGVEYDVIVDTTSKTPMSCAQEIVSEIIAGPGEQWKEIQEGGSDMSC